ncbi:MAG: serine/threonine protein kinase [Planctomycetaceae bacterium]|nr:serine/threonine protein kinase [Planctomycetaceae bacterium]
MAQQGDKGRSNGSMDTELSRLVVERNLATAEELQECLGRRSTDKNMTLADVLIDQGIVTRRQIDRLKQSIEDRRHQQIPGYQLLDKLGSGAMATVFRAKQLSLDRMVAVKVLPRKLSENAEYVERFYREGKAAAKLNHPNIVQAFDVGENAGFHYFVMEYVEGHTLWDELASGKVFSEAEALKVIIQIARALEHAHKQGLIHRDVKPKNIMVTPDGTCKLADMGLARQAADEKIAVEEAGRAFGTPYYISPEQIRGETNIDFRADIYSLGATLYHLLTGQVPFEAATPLAVMQKHLKEDLIPPDHINAGLSAGIGEVVEVMMAKDRKRRYASTTDLLLDLEAIAAGEAPLQARKQIDADLLTALDQRDDAEAANTIEVKAPNNLLAYLVIALAALAVSLIVNIILALSAAR